MNFELEQIKEMIYVIRGQKVVIWQNFMALKQGC